VVDPGGDPPECSGTTGRHAAYGIRMRRSDYITGPPVVIRGIKPNF
jgi:hypothetical protein